MSFRSEKLRNLRGIGPVKISEIRWDKFLQIRKEENDLAQKQLKALAEILSKKNCPQ
ncbi:hypothetical protein [Nitrosopumilus sp.]|uniref:hypothetical protein n=1 Tax=Nitrosopumilus sp. TaxID=2024843 RepID=UPI0029305910|nr:hypothetical protein [Nitrosopumilus sp.]